MAYLTYNSSTPYDSSVPYSGLTFGVDDAISKPAIESIVLAEVTVAFWGRNWVQATAPNTSAYYIELPAGIEQVLSVKWDLSAGTEQSSVANVHANVKSWYWDQDAGRIYVSGQTGETPFDRTITVDLKFRWATKGCVYEDRHYTGRILSVPGISSRIEQNFSGIGQIGGGNLVVANADGELDELRTLKWQHGSAQLLWGANTALDAMTYGSFEPLGTWLIEDWTFEPEKVTFKLRERKLRTDTKIPTTVYSRDDYPVISAREEGDPIPLAYGRIYSAKPKCVNVSTKTFKVASHAIHSFVDVRIKDGDSWVQSSFATTDEANAEFTLGADWSQNMEVAVDFIGRKNNDGSPMLNAADIVEDLLAQVGETNVNAASFAEARARLSIGFDTDGNEINHREVSLFIDEEVRLSEVLGKINQNCGSFLYSNADGEYSFHVWWPQPSEEMASYATDELIAFAEMTKTKDLLSDLTVRHTIRTQEDDAQSVTYASDANQYSAGFSAPIVASFDSLFTLDRDARYLAQRRVRCEGRGLRTWSVTLPWRGFFLTPGDQFILDYERLGEEYVVEALDVQLDVIGGKVKLTVGDLRGTADDVGFWVADTDTLPTRFSGLTGYGVGSLTWNAAWDPAIKDWARKNVGYWTDENGFADPDDPESYIPSCWI